MRWILEWDGDIQLEFASWDYGCIFPDKTPWDMQNSIQISSGKGGKSFPKQELVGMVFLPLS